MNYGIIFYVIGWVLNFEAAFMLPSCITAFVYHEREGLALAAVAAVSLLAGLLIIRKKPKSMSMYAREGFVTVALCWIIMSAVGALPFVLAGAIPSYIDAIFETVSGFTTTGSSILPEVESMAHCLLFWRSFTHWIGGMGVLVFVMAVLPLAGGTNMYMMKAESPGPSVGKLVPRVKRTAVILYGMYVGLSILQLVFLLAGKMPVFDALVTMFGTAGTGGFGIKNDSMGSYSPYIQWVVTVFMILFGVNFNLYYLLLARKFRAAAQCSECWYYSAIALASTAMIAINIFPIYGSVADAVRHSAFQVSSIVTTTGYATADFDRWPELSKAILVILMFFGGCMGSTAGGLKMSRVTVLMQVIRNDLRHALRPREVSSVKLNGRRLDAQGEKQVLSYFAVYMAVIGAAFLLISFEPFGFETNFTAAVSCVNNIGPGLAGVGPSLSYAGYSVFSKLILSFAMLLGRLEIYPLLLLLSPQIWTKR